MHFSAIFAIGRALSPIIAHESAKQDDPFILSFQEVNAPDIDFFLQAWNSKAEQNRNELSRLQTGFSFLYGLLCFPCSQSERNRQECINPKQQQCLRLYFLQ